MEADGKTLKGFNVYVGGGMGRTHNKESTFARIAEPLGFVPAEQALELGKAVLAAQRDHGNREVSRRATARPGPAPRRACAGCTARAAQPGRAQPHGASTRPRRPCASPCPRRRPGRLVPRRCARTRG